MLLRWLAAVPALLLLSCTGLGRVPQELVDLYDQASPDGVIEMELDRDGRIREMEAEIPVSELPVTVREAALRRVAGGQITGAERELKAEGTCWEVKMRHQDRDWELVVDGRGKVIEIEKELRRSEAPAAVLDAAETAIPGGQFRSVELIERGPESEYHVKLSRDGASYKVVLGPGGEVLRRVREARAEIEIPLKK